MTEACEKILDKIAVAGRKVDLLRIDNQIPDAGLDADEQLYCERRVEERLAELNQFTPPQRTQRRVRATIHVQPGKG